MASQMSVLHGFPLLGRRLLSAEIHKCCGLSIQCTEMDKMGGYGIVVSMARGMLKDMRHARDETSRGCDPSY